MRNVDGESSHLTELEELRQEVKQLVLANKKLARALDLAQKQMQRNKLTAEAHDNVSRMISAKRSELERYMNLLLGNCPDMILLFDNEGRIAYCTDSFLKLCGIPGFGMVQGKTCAELLSPYTNPEFQTQMEEIFSRVYAENIPVTFNGMVDFSQNAADRSYNIQATPMLGESGTVEGAMIIFSDTTDILRAQREAERANTAKSDFLATVSHEIRTPMNAIIGVSGMLKSTGLDTKQHEYLRNIQDSSHILLNLINDILDFSKIEAGKLELLQEYFSLPIQLKHLQSMFELMFQPKGLDFRCCFAEDLPEVVYGDEKRISQVLTNILNNALKYTKQGNVRFDVSRQPGGFICFRITDTGVGIMEDAIPRLFTAFERLDEVHNKAVVGTGLGLAITKRLCDLMEGVIEVESVYGEGSVFTVCLPLKEGRLEDLPAIERKDAVKFTAPEVKALLVDDIEINLQIAAYMLEIFNINADFVTSGAQAIEKVKKNDYDIIFMDHMMPEMDGIEAAKIIRGLGGSAAEIPIVALTANAVSSAVETFYRNGFDDFLSKPMDEAALAVCLLRRLPPGKIVYYDEAK